MDRRPIYGAQVIGAPQKAGELVNRWSDPALATVRPDLLVTLDDVTRHDLGRVPPQVCEMG